MKSMRRQLVALAFLAGLIPVQGECQKGTPVPQHLICKIGPLTKLYGGTKWLVYSCDDSKTVIVVSAPSNPAAPFYFTFSPEQSGYHLRGEGTGDHAATDSAYKALSTLSDHDIAALLAETKRH